MYYVYRYISDIDGIIKYIGITNDLSRRIREHSNESKFKCDTFKIEYVEVSTEEEAFDLETYLIQKYDTGRYLNESKLKAAYSSSCESFVFDWILYKSAYDVAKEWLDSLMNPGFSDKLFQIQTEKMKCKHDDVLQKYVGRSKVFDNGYACKVIDIEDGLLVCDFGTRIDKMSLNMFKTRKGHLI